MKPLLSFCQFARRSKWARLVNPPLLTAVVCTALLGLRLASAALQLVDQKTDRLLNQHAPSLTLEPNELTARLDGAPEPAAGPEPAPARAAPGADATDMGAGLVCPTTLEGLEDVAADVVRRRKSLVERESQLVLHEAAIAEAAQRLGAEAERLETLRAKLEAQLKELSEADKARLVQLVKMYETMKPKQAAEVFNGLELGLLVDLLSRMREPKSAAILAAMLPDKAQQLTAELANRRTHEVELVGTK